MFRENVVINLAVSLRAEIKINKAAAGITIINNNRARRETFSALDELAEANDTVLFYHALKAARVGGGIEITFETGSPFGAGLGGSSVLLIALLKGLFLFKGSEIENDLLIDTAGEIEKEIIKGPIGKQDYVAAVYGGLNGIRFDESGKYSLEPLESALDWLGKKTSVYFTGQAHFSGNTNFIIVDKCLEGDPETIRVMKALEANSNHIYEAIITRDARVLLELLRLEMNLRRDLLPGITTPQIELLREKAESLGGALKVCGAGGGGSVFVYFPERVPTEFSEFAVSEGARMLECRPDRTGLKVY
jgi:D-glycero-alpha-D-manno-heptose-7-phosphate kinase